MTPYPIQQSPDFTEILARAGASAHQVLAGANCVQVIDRGPVRYVSRPPATADLRALRGKRVTVINAGRDTNNIRASGYVRIMSGASIAVLDTSKPMRPAQKWRNALTKSRHFKTRITHRPLHPTDDWLFKLDAAQQAAKSYRGLPHQISQHWPQRYTVLSVAWHKKSPIAAMLHLIHGHAATYQIGWSGREGRRVNAHNLLLYDVAGKLRDIGVETLELGLVDTHNAPGLARFKIGSGAKVIKLGGTWIAPPRWIS